MTDDRETVHYNGPAGGWGSLQSIARIFGKEWATPTAVETLARQNNTHGFMCVSCSWAKPADVHPLEFCENGAKATLWETLRSNDQFNTTIYGFSDRLRGIAGRSDVLLINPKEMERANLSVGQVVTLVRDAGDGVEREVGGLKVTPFDLPDGCLGGYYPEMNPLMQGRSAI